MFSFENGGQYYLASARGGSHNLKGTVFMLMILNLHMDNIQHELLHIRNLGHFFISKDSNKLIGIT